MSKDCRYTGKFCELRCGGQFPAIFLSLQFLKEGRLRPRQMTSLVLWTMSRQQVAMRNTADRDERPTLQAASLMLCPA